MPALVQINFASDSLHDFTDADDLFLIAAFNRLPLSVTSDSLLQRQHRVFLISMADDLNVRVRKAYDVLDVLLRAQELDAQNRLRNRAPVANVDVLDDDNIELGEN